MRRGLSDADYDALKRRNLRDRGPASRTSCARTRRQPEGRRGALGEVQGRRAWRADAQSLDNAFADEDAVEFDARIRRFLKCG
jgi:DNA ligase (NAD+)